MTLLAIILAFALFHWVEKPQWLCVFEYLKSLHNGLLETVKIQSHWVRVVLMLALPLLLLTLMMEWLHVDTPYRNSAWYLLVHTLVLYYCLGPKAMDSEMADGKLRSQLDLDGTEDHKAIIDGMTSAAMKRWFGVFFWYLILGLWGALLYRLVERISDLMAEDEAVSALSSEILSWLNFPASLLMTVALAVASDFEKVWEKCKPYLNWGTVQKINSQFLYDAMFASVEYSELEDESGSVDQVMNTTLGVLKRMLVACLVFVALLVLFSVR